MIAAEPQPIFIEPQLGLAPEMPAFPLPPEDEDFVGARAAPSSTGGFGFLDLQNRDVSKAFYQAVYGASTGVAIGWTGDTATCSPGTTSQVFKDATLIRVNYYRAMAGVPDTVAFDSTYSAKSQDAAEMMSRANSLSHTPDATWPCYTANGDEAAGKSNLSLGNYGYDAVMSQMRDNGSNNTAAGHRRWILYPQTQLMGTGDVDDDGSYNRANSLWVFDSHTWDARPAVSREGYAATPALPLTPIAWPPAGYAPYDVVYPRWSFSYPSANFANTNIAVFENGALVSAAKETVANGYGENTLVWVMKGLAANTSSTSWPKPASDTEYLVALDNVSIGGVNYDITYTVTVFDPATAGPAEVLPAISGSSSITTAGANYTHTQISFTPDDYQSRELQLQAYQGNEGGESGSGLLLDGTSALYPLLTTDKKKTGNYSMHLAHPAGIATEYFELNRTFLLTSTSTFSFYSMLGYASTDQTAMAQISLDDGASWTTLYSRAGTGGAGETSFSQHSYSLSGYANKTARFRFSYVFPGGSAYPQTSAGVGFYVDDIAVTNALEVAAVTDKLIGNTGSFTYTPSAAGTYGLQVRAVPWTGFSGLNWGPVKTITVASAPSCNGGVVTVNSSFSSGQTITCTATTSLTTSGTVTVPTNANVTFKAPLVDLKPGFTASSGSTFHAMQ